MNKKIFLLAVGLVIFFVPFWQSGDLITELAPGLMFIMFLVSLFSLAQQKRLSFSQLCCPEILAVFLMVTTYGTLTVGWSVIPDVSLQQAFRLWFYFLAFFIVSQTFGKQSVRTLMSVFLLAAFIESVYAIYLFVFTVDSFDIGSYWVRAMGTFPGPNAFGMYMGLAFLIGLGSIRYASEGKTRWHIVFLLPFFVVALVLTFSRGSAAATIFGVIVFLFTQGNRRFLIKPIFTVLLGTMLLSSIIYMVGPEIKMGSVEQRFTATSEVGTLNNRTAIWQATIEMAKDRPVFGWGIGSFGRVYGSYQQSLQQYPNSAHNHYLQVWAEQGLVGLALFLILLMLFYRRVIKLLLYRRNDPQLNALIAAVTAFLMHIIIDFDWDFFALASTFFILAGGILGIYREEIPADNMRFQWTKVVRVASLTILLFCLTIYSLWNVGQEFTRRGLEKVQQGDLAGGRSDLQLASTLNGFNAANHIYLAYSYQMEIEGGEKSPEILGKVSEQLEAAQALDLKNPWIYNQLGHTYWQLGDRNKAEGYLKKAVELYRGDIKFHNDLAAFYQQENQFQKAEQAYRRALDLVEQVSDYSINEYVRGVVNLSQLYSSRNQEKEALEVVGEALLKFPDNEELITLQAQMKGSRI